MHCNTPTTHLTAVCCSLLWVCFSCGGCLVYLLPSEPLPLSRHALQHTATHCNTPATRTCRIQLLPSEPLRYLSRHCNTLQRTRNTTTTHPQHTGNTPATHPQHTRNTPTTHLQHTHNTPATHPQHTRNTPATHPQHTRNTNLSYTAAAA